MAATALQQVFHSVVISRFTQARLRHPGVVGLYDVRRPIAYRRCLASCCPDDLWSSAATSEPLTFADLCFTADDELFNKIVTNPNHILHKSLPPSQYTLMDGAHIHHCSYLDNATHLSDCNYILRMLYKNCY